MLLESMAHCDLSHRVCCIVDADYEAGRKPQVTGALLLYTDVSSMPVYAFAAPHIQRYLDVVVLGFPFSGEQVVAQLSKVLRYISATRLAMSSLSIGTPSVPIADDCKLRGNSIEFDVDRFTVRWLNKAASMARRAECDAAREKQHASLAADPQLWIESADFIALFHWLLCRARGASRTVEPRLLSRVLLLGIPLHDVLDWGLFREIIRRFSNQAS